jgi:hypothetical protein
MNTIQPAHMNDARVRTVSIWAGIRIGGEIGKVCHFDLA